MLTPYRNRSATLTKSIPHRTTTVPQHQPNPFHTVRHSRACCKWLRNGTNRLHLAKKLKGIISNAEKLLDSFSANVAKWRYETLDVCFLELLPLRELLQCFDVRWFPSPQDREELNAFVRAITWQEFWTFMAVAHKFGIKHFERHRRWGLVCACCKHLRALGNKRPSCPRSSRRMREARKYIISLLEEMKVRIDSITLSDCEDSFPMMRWIVHSLKCSRNDIGEKFSWTRTVPWLFCEADDQEQALEILVQIETTTDQATIDLNKSLRADLVAVSLGGPCPALLQRKVTAIDNSPLDEGKGESFHRNTNLEQGRSTNARLPWIKTSVRQAQVLQRARAIMRTFGVKGRAVINLEFRLYKRVLQVKKNAHWKNSKLGPKAFFKRLYRMDEQAAEDWAPLLENVAPQKPGSSWTPGQAMQSEYMDAPRPSYIFK